MSSPSTSPHQSLLLTLNLPPGPSLGVNIRKSATDGISCVVVAITSESSPLMVGDVVESLNGRVLVDVEGGIPAWVELFASFANDTRTVVVRRRIIGNAIDDDDE